MNFVFSIKTSKYLDISKGERLESPEDLQFYENNKKDIESELKNIAEKEQKQKAEPKPTKTLTNEEKVKQLRAEEQAELNDAINGWLLR